MAYITDNKLDAAVKSSLQTAEKIFTPPKAVGQLGSVESSAQVSAEQKTEMYFQIED